MAQNLTSWQLMSIWSTNQRAFGSIKALAYWTATGIFLEAELTVHATHWTLAANKRFLCLRFWIRRLVFITRVRVRVRRRIV